jgi:voltage-gated sodium channel
MINRIRTAPAFFSIFRETEFDTDTNGKIEKDTRPGNFIMSVIIVNCMVLFLHSFNRYHGYYMTLEWVDHFCTVLFVIEITVNIYERGWGYLKNAWHLFDAFIVLICLLTFIVFILHLNDLVPDLEYLLVARIFRVFKFYRLFEGSFNIKSMFKALGKGLKASLYIVAAFLIYNFVVSLISYYIFHGFSPEHYDNGLLAFYSTFKAFTGQAFEIADSMVFESPVAIFFVKLYFILVVITGGIIGLSLINTIFINEVTGEHAKETQGEIFEVQDEIKGLKEKLNNIESTLKRIEEKIIK